MIARTLRLTLDVTTRANHGESIEDIVRDVDVLLGDREILAVDVINKEDLNGIK